MLISYNVNTFDFWDHFSNAGIYRPRFIDLEIPGEPAAIDAQRTVQSHAFMLAQNYPNPFNPVTNIEYQLSKSEYVSLKVYDLLGQEVASLVSERQNAGLHIIKWDASGYASGVYVYRLIINQRHSETRKLVLMK